MESAPKWLNEQPLIIDILNYCITRLERRQDEDRVVSVILTKKRFPELFTIVEEEADLIWRLLSQLATEYQIWQVVQGKTTIHDFAYKNAKLQFNQVREGVVRKWLNRPKKPSYKECWQQSVKALASSFLVNIEKLFQYPIKVEGIEIEKILQGFVAIKKHIGCPIYLRQLSANCFWGDSKFLDGREALIESLYPGILSSLLPRPIIVHAYLPDHFKGILFIENQDSFTYCLRNGSFVPKAYGIVYLSGFKLTAEKVRSTAGVCFHYSSGSSMAEQSRFEVWWCKQDDDKSADDIQGLFWGDLDFSGMYILKLLRSRFSNLCCWKHPYELMADLINDGHAPESTGKSDQIDPGITGCDYADNVLLPLIRDKKRFIDQEVVY